MSTERSRVAGSWFAIAAGIVGVVVDAAYLGIIFDQGDAEVARVAVVSIFILAVSVLAFAGAFAAALSARSRLAVLGAAAGGLITAGVLGLFSIGLPLLVAGMACGVAWARFARSVGPVPAGAPLLSALAAIGTGALLVLGISLS